MEAEGKMSKQNYQRLKELIEQKGLDATDLMDVMTDQSLKDVVEYWDSHCTCGNSVNSEYEEYHCTECR